jgi:hypothetical protein
MFRVVCLLCACGLAVVIWAAVDAERATAVWPRAVGEVRSLIERSDPGSALHDEREQPEPVGRRYTWSVRSEYAYERYCDSFRAQAVAAGYRAVEPRNDGTLPFARSEPGELHLLELRPVSSPPGVHVNYRVVPD